MTALSSVRVLAVAAAAMLAMQAHAGNRLTTAPATGPVLPVADLVPTLIDVSVAGFVSCGGFGDPGNSQVFLNIGAGSTVTGWDCQNLSFSTNGSSWLSEFVISVNNTNGSQYFDAAPATSMPAAPSAPLRVRGPARWGASRVRPSWPPTARCGSPSASCTPTPTPA